MISDKDINYEKNFYEKLKRYHKNKERGFPEGNK